MDYTENSPETTQKEEKYTENGGKYAENGGKYTENREKYTENEKKYTENGDQQLKNYTEKKLALINNVGKYAFPILELINNNPKVTISEMVAALGVSRPTVTNYIKKLQLANIVRRSGSDRGGRWDILL